MEGQPSEFALNVRRVDGTVTVEVQGEVDGATADYLRTVLSDLIRDQGNLKLTLDLAEMAFIDSTGMSVLVDALGWSREVGSTITLARPRPSAARLFELVGLDKVLTITSAGGVDAPGSLPFGA